MRDMTAVRERYLRDGLPVRLGGLAANLARVSSFSRSAASREAVSSLLDESKYFIEWTAAEAELDAATQLVDLQRQLAQWQLDWDKIWADGTRRAGVA
ncbi:MAG: hypothetical protein M3Y28_05595 [Armatimonadota bacterium]|nr:hypothetical protein [Armatimonadota bacterium]